MSPPPPRSSRPTPGGPYGPDRPKGRRPFQAIPQSLADQFTARLLDPATAVQRPDQKLEPTVYIPNHLLVHGFPSENAALADLKDFATQNGLVAQESDFDLANGARVAGTKTGELLNAVWLTLVELTPQEGSLVVPVDAWPFLQDFRYSYPETSKRVSLNHVLCGSPSYEGAGGYWGGVGGYWGGVGGYWGGVGGYWGGVGQKLSEYSSPGFGGRTPVVWQAEDPRLRAQALDRPPVVAIFDTGIGKHPWFPAPGNGYEYPTGVDGLPIGLTAPPAPDPEATGVVTDPLNGVMDLEAGHGTFIAGIIRQRCPEARILAIHVMAADGSADEVSVHRAMVALLERHVNARDTGKTKDLVDIVNLSMGFYHEEPDDPDANAALKELLRAYAVAGIAVVAAAGNDGTTREFFPAAYALPEGAALPRPTEVPLVSVGALNPDGETIALFSNSGRWVTTHRRGAAVVSTVPVTLQGAGQASVYVVRNDPLPRATIDTDDFSSGFAIWSGTSFAAPVLAGDIAAEIVRGGGGDEAPAKVGKAAQLDPEAIKAATKAAVKRGRSALSKALKRST